MKNLIKVFGLALCVLLFNVALSQNSVENIQEEVIYSQSINDCKVLGDLKGDYVGKCKKGLAHGKGVFTYSDIDNVYEGRFMKGKMNGKGIVYKIKDGEREIIRKGIWEDNIYIGEKKKDPYSVDQALFIEKTTITKRFDKGNKVYFNFVQNGGRNSVSNVQIQSDSGNEIVASDTFGVTAVNFPFTCYVTYVSFNKFRTTSFTARLKVTINEPGVWDVELQN